MATFNSAKELAKYQKARAAAFQRLTGKVTQKEGDRLAKRMQTRALQLTSGTRTTRELAILGHPYKRSRRRYTSRERAARAVLKSARLLPINRQSGRLQEEMKVYAVIRRLGRDTRLILRIKNAAPYALFQLDPEGKGTKTMRPRGFWKALVKSYGRYNAQQIKSAQRKAQRAARRYLRA